MGGESKQPPLPQTKTEEILSVLPLGQIRCESAIPHENLTPADTFRVRLMR